MYQFLKLMRHELRISSQTNHRNKYAIFRLEDCGKCSPAGFYAGAQLFSFILILMGVLRII